jgi:hypothetical protein
MVLSALLWPSTEHRQLHKIHDSRSALACLKRAARKPAGAASSSKTSLGRSNAHLSCCAKILCHALIIGILEPVTVLARPGLGLHGIGTPRLHHTVAVHGARRATHLAISPARRRRCRGSSSGPAAGQPAARAGRTDGCGIVPRRRRRRSKGSRLAARPGGPDTCRHAHNSDHACPLVAPVLDSPRCSVLTIAAACTAGVVIAYAGPAHACA